jgi:O-acetylhomoserine (thiol)-lyase
MTQQADEYGFDTRSIHAGTDPDAGTGARAPPIHQTTSFVFDDPDHAARLFALEEEGFIYSRLLNPTVKQLGDRLADLEGGVGAVPTSSGMAAFDLVNFLLTSAGDNIVSAKSLYGGTYTYLTHTVERRGVTTRFVDTLDYEAYEEAIDENTAYVHLETVGNPALTTPDIERVADIAHENGVPLFVDNTFATPALCRPLEHGADIVWESTTKWIHGAGSTIGGVVVDGGSFPWEEHAEKYPEIAQDNPAYHGVNFAERFDDAALTYAAIGRGTRSLGNSQAPFDAWVTLQKLESFPLRVERHAENALAVAEFLDDHSDVEWVSYPGLPSHETHEEASEYLDGGYGGMLTFGLGDFETAKAAVGNTELASLLANVGDAKTLVIHPASTTHQQLTEEEQLAAGVKPDMIRLSVGIENAEDIIADLDQAIEQAN